MKTKNTYLWPSKLSPERFEALAKLREIIEEMVEYKQFDIKSLIDSADFYGQSIDDSNCHMFKMADGNFIQVPISGKSCVSKVEERKYSAKYKLRNIK